MLLRDIQRQHNEFVEEKLALGILQVVGILLVEIVQDNLVVLVLDNYFVVEWGVGIHFVVEQNQHFQSIPLLLVEEKNFE